MDSQNIHGIILQLKSITERVNKSDTFIYIYFLFLAGKYDDFMKEILRKS